MVSPDTLVRIHWIGSERLGLDAGAFTLNRILALSETQSFQRQTLDKIPRALWRLASGKGEHADPNFWLLRPLLDDVVQNECYFELRRTTNQLDEVIFAIRLNDQSAGLWATNLANVFASLTGVWPVASRQFNSWTLARELPQSRIELVRAGAWTVLGAGYGSNRLLHAIVDRVQSYSDPFRAPGTNHWLDADLDLERLGIVPSDAPVPAGGLPSMSLSLSGDGANVHTHAELNFPRPLPIQIEPWSIPTNRIAEPLIGFTAIRGFQPWLASWKPWNDLRIGLPPNQLVSWSPDGLAQQVIVALPHPRAAEQVAAATALLLSRGNAWLTNNGIGRFEALPESKGVIWTGFPYVFPFIRSVDSGRMILCAMDPSHAQGTNTQNGMNFRSSVPELVQFINSDTNLIAYDWELTGPRVESSLFITQMFRVALRRFPLPTESPNIGWLGSIKDRLGATSTRTTRTGPHQLQFDRTSTIGFTGIELSLLADWLESPQLPKPLHSTAALPANP